jgi:hypothetical protein
MTLHAHSALASRQLFYALPLVIDAAAGAD